MQVEATNRIKTQPMTQPGSTPNTIHAIANAALYLVKTMFSSLGYATHSMASYCVNAVHNWKYASLTTSQKQALHNQECSRILNKCQHWRDSQQQIVLEPKETTFLFRPRKAAPSRLDLRQLNQVISIDQANRTAHVQGLITFDALFEATLKVGLRPKVIPELRGITIGGAISGLAVESSSFKEGLFHHSVIEMEVLTGTGEIITCSAKHHSDLFYAIPNSYGTLGYILSAKIELAAAKPFVDVEYKHFEDADSYFKALEEACQKTEAYDFIDGAIFSEKEMVLILGKNVDSPSMRTADYLKNGIYYKELQKKDKIKDSFTMRDYIWRWDRDHFWATENTFLQNPLFRKTLGPYALRSDRLSLFRRFMREFQKHVITPFQTTRINKKELIQDVGVPVENCAEFYHWFKKEIGIHPIFICPVRPDTWPTPLWDLPRNGLYCDVGFFDRIKTEHADGYYNSKVEQKLIEIDARKSLYSRCYYPENDFKKLYYGNGAYEKLKQKFDPKGRFATLYQKCVKGV